MTGRAALLYHLTAKEKAFSILQTTAIFGLDAGGENNAEAYAHFSHDRFRQGRNDIDVDEFALEFACTLPERRGGGVPANGLSFEPEVLHIQFFDWNPDQPETAQDFWQAIIHPSTPAPLRFIGYRYDEALLTVSERRFLRSHVEARTVINVVWNPISMLARTARQRPLQKPSRWRRFFIK